MPADISRELRIPQELRRLPDHRWLRFWIDLLLLLAAIVFAYVARRGHLRFEPEYIRILPYFLISWLIGSILGGKFADTRLERRFMLRLSPYAVSAFLSAGILSFILNYLDWTRLSWFIIFGALTIHLLLELILLSGNYFILFRRGEHAGARSFSFLFMLAEAIVAAGAFINLHYYKIGDVVIKDEQKSVFVILLAFWLFSGLVIHRFRLPSSQKESWLQAVEPYLRSLIVTASGVSIVILGLRVLPTHRELPFLALLILAGFELLFVTFYYLYKLPKLSDLPEGGLYDEDMERANLIDSQTAKDAPGKLELYALKKEDFKSKFLRDKLKKVYLKDQPDVFDFLDNALKLSSFDVIRSEVIETSNPYNVEILPDRSEEFIMNNRPLNSLRFINEYLIAANRKLVDDGVLVGSFSPHELRWIYFCERYPRVVARLAYFCEFVWKRVFPKIPLLSKLYYYISQGRNRLFSFAQGLGRLYYCGFEVIALQIVADRVYFCVARVKEPSDIKNPSYGLFFRQPRVGKDGKIVRIYKMRTMHPFSEFIHQFVLDRNSLDDKGKIKDDFRITGWGRIMRKLWLDELPMLLNLLKGDIKLVGVRPLSKTFFATYPKDLQQTRVKTKPGLIPPYYADMPKNMDEVFDSERRYLEAYQKKPLRTDWKYFFAAFRNIVFRGAKSG